MTKEFYYTNLLGYHKRLTITPKDANIYYYNITCMDNGEYCDHGTITLEKLNEFLYEYGLSFDGHF